ncbi:MAG: TylF/MycF family methyltransferase [Candidatus Nomurabacteria bacterium]|jgi:O-methyltransferase|nr:TylF/MycF family methyltransferase [Candidatus Nomurabacteria bacterium]
MRQVQQVSRQSLAVILRELRAVLARGVIGDAVEFGCYAGDTSIELWKILQEFNRLNRAANRPRNANVKNFNAPNSAAELPPKNLWLYDSFEGLPVKTTDDLAAGGEDFTAGELKVSKADVVRKFQKLGLGIPIVKKAWFADLTARDLPRQICLAFLDGDFYRSIRQSFDLVKPRLSPGSTVIVDDYQNAKLPGSKKAVDEFLAQNPAVKFNVEAGLAIVKWPN